MSKQGEPHVIDTQKLEEAARMELAFLWGDLDTARRNAYNGEWSTACDGLEERIKTLTTLIGPTPWQQIQIPLMELGIYQRIHADLGIDVPEVRPDMGVIAAMRADLDRQAASVGR